MRRVEGLNGSRAQRDKLQELQQRVADRLVDRLWARLSSSYRGGEQSRFNTDWVTGGGSADHDLRDDLFRMRERSRELVRNDGLARSAIDVFCSNVVGRGLRPQSAIRADRLGIDEKVADEIRSRIEDRFEVWCKTSDATETTDFYGQQDLVLRQMLENGDVFTRPVMVFDDPSRPYELAIELIEADRIDTPPGRDGDPSIRFGVELGGRGQPLAYHVRRAHPGDMYRQTEAWRFDRIPRRTPSGVVQMLHHYRPLRPGQSRGVPILGPVLQDIHDRRSYLEAERIAARAAACISLIFVSPNAESDITGASAGLIEELEPGTIQHGAPGEDVRAFDPSRPTNTFDPFLQKLERTIGNGIGLSYDSLTRDTSKSNFSNARTAIMADRRIFRSVQQFLISSFCRPYWQLFVEELFLKGELEEAGSLAQFDANRDEWSRVDFIPDGWEWLDPEKDVKSMMLAVEAGFDSRTRIAGSLGRDIEKIAMEQKYENELFGAAKASLTNTEDDTTDEDGDDADDAEAEDSGEDSRERSATGARDSD